MISDIAVFVLAVIGIISVFYSIIFRVTAMLTEDITIVIPLHNDDESIHTRLNYILSLLDFCHIKKKCTIVIENYGASDEYFDKLKDCYRSYDNIKINVL
mgnify:CR=1 FL=1